MAWVEAERGVGLEREGMDVLSTRLVPGIQEGELKKKRKDKNWVRSQGPGHSTVGRSFPPRAKQKGKKREIKKKGKRRARGPWPSRF